MNKRPNPFMPNPYPQPPLPAGPPPPQQPQQYDYSAYWAAAAAAQQAQTGAPAQANPQWAPPTVGAQPPQPPPRTSEQNALYANYGYGGAAGQQQAMLAAQQQQQQRPAAPYWTPPAPGYAPAPYPYPQQPPNAYQPTQPPPPFVPPVPVYQPQPIPQQVPPPPPPQRRFQPPPQPPQQQPHHLPAPPAKRPRFDSGPPNPNNNNNWRPNNNSNGIPTAPAQHGNFPPQQPGFDRFSGNRGRGGGVMLSNNNNAGNNNRGRGFNHNQHGHNRNFNRHGNNPPRGPSGFNRNSTNAPLGPRHGLPANPTKRERESKRDRLDREREGSLAESEGVERGHGGKRTLTDFRIVGVECGVIGWEWGVVAKEKNEEKDEDEEKKVKEEPASPAKSVSGGKAPQPAPSRLRIYFHSASDPEADAVPRKRKKDVDEEDEEGGARKKVQGGEIDKEKAEKHEDDEAFGSERADETHDLSYPASPDDQDAVSYKPPPTPGESTPTPRDISTEIPGLGFVAVHDEAPEAESEAPPVEDGATVEKELEPSVNGDDVPTLQEPPIESGDAAPIEDGPTVSAENGQNKPAKNDQGTHDEPNPSNPGQSTLSEQVPETESEVAPAAPDTDANASTVEGQEPPAPAEEQNADSAAPDTPAEADMSASTIAPEDLSFVEPVVFPTLDPPTHNATDRSANRISISYANSTRRLVIDADVVRKVRIVRAKARVEITLEVVVVRQAEEVKEEQGDKIALGPGDRFRGVLVEAFNDSTQRYELITPHAATLGDDLTIPDLSKVGQTPAEITIVVHLDRDKPLTETKWVKTGDLDEWLSNEFGPIRPDPSGRANWSGKIEVADPDPAPTITTLMEAWCGHTMVGQPKERRRFVRQHMSNIDHVLEILLRLVRGERATAGGGQQQTHVSLAVLAIFRVATEYGARAGVEREVVEERVSEIVRALPTHLVYKSLDGMFREWSFSQKKGDKKA